MNAHHAGTPRGGCQGSKGKLNLFLKKKRFEGKKQSLLLLTPANNCYTPKLSKLFFGDVKELDLQLLLFHFPFAQAIRKQRKWATVGCQGVYFCFM